MRIKSVLASTLLLIISCNNQDTRNEVVVEGFVRNVPDGKIYLTEAHHWQVPLDSTVCKNGHFVFRIKIDSSFVPYKASLKYPDSTKPYKISSIFFRNYMRGADSSRYSTDAFYLEEGYTRIEGDNQAKPAPRIFSGKETDVMYQFHGGFGWIGNVDSNARLRRINYYKTQIKKYPSSYFLLREIYGAKEQYSENELSEVFSLFTADIKKSKLGDEVRTYLQNRPDPNTPYPNLLLVNSKNRKGNIIDQKSKVNMIAFWASWCGPCRKEIPVLKEFHQQFKDKGLNLVSVSIDEDRDMWENALGQEKMTWEQYIVEKDEIDLVRQQFNFSVIPFVLFTDQKGLEIKRFIGYDKEQKKNYEAVLRNFIDNKQ